jgi:4,4'-diaponeurosporenoate glycosyltransferase
VIALFIFCALGLPAGFLLLKRVPLCEAFAGKAVVNATVIIPARNEESTLPILLSSLQGVHQSPLQVLVVNDGSTDSTVAVAQAHGATVIDVVPPSGWTGKTWACFQGSKGATSPNMLFLDADTWFSPGGYDRVASASLHTALAVSVLPYHVTSKVYEELSLFFNLLMAFGAGGFGRLGRGRLFGQSLLISSELYRRFGGHSTVQGTILENLAMADWVESAGGHCVCLGGHGTLNMRMFPTGIRQLWQGWAKAFTSGAAASSPRILAVSVYWLSSLASTPLSFMFVHGPWRPAFAALYLCLAAQVFWFARQIATFRVVTCFLYPLPLVFFFVVFTQALIRRTLKKQVTWRGRQL